MVLNKRYIRNFRSNLSFFLSITILTALVSCLHVAFDSSYGVQQESFTELLDVCSRSSHVDYRKCPKGGHLNYSFLYH